MADVLLRFKNAWNAFASKETTNPSPSITHITQWSTQRPDRTTYSRTSSKTIVNSIYNRIAVDVSQVTVLHARVDQNGKYVETISSHLNNALTLDPNVDQTAKDLMIDIVTSMFDEGVVAVVPVDTTINPLSSNAYDIDTLRTGQIKEWFPKHVRISVYDENDGKRKEIIMPKKAVAIITNPFYQIMNEPNSTLKRLVNKLALLDGVDNRACSGKLDLILQLPYVVKTPAMKARAEERRKDIEDQLAGSAYGIAYTDGTERITQLNRAVDNNLSAQVDRLTSMLYSQLGLTEEIFNGTADEAAQLNYYNCTIVPILSAIVDEMNRKFLTKTARTQNQSIVFLRDPFKLVPVSQVAEIADKFTRNEIMSSNEIRAIVGYKPSDDPAADELRNKNLNQSNQVINDKSSNADNLDKEENNQNGTKL